MLISPRMFVTVIFFTLMASSNLPAQKTDDLAFQRAQHLRRGINTSDWFAQSGDYSVQRLRAFTTPDDIRLIHHLGFDHIRLSIDADPLLAWQRKQPNGAAYMEELDSIVNLALQQTRSRYPARSPDS